MFGQLGRIHSRTTSTFYNPNSSYTVDNQLNYYYFTVSCFVTSRFESNSVKTVHILFNNGPPTYINWAEFQATAFMLIRNMLPQEGVAVKHENSFPFFTNT